MIDAVRGTHSWVYSRRIAWSEAVHRGVLRTNFMLTTMIASICIASSAHALTMMECGNQCLKYRDYKKAEGYFKAEIASHSSNAEAHFGLSKALYFQQRMSETAKELQLVITLDGNGAYGRQAKLSMA